MVVFLTRKITALSQLLTLTAPGIASVGLAAMATAFTALPAFGQLRSGRLERGFYQNELQPRPDQRPHSRQPVVAASHTSQTSQSILEENRAARQSAPPQTPMEPPMEPFALENQASAAPMVYGDTGEGSYDFGTHGSGMSSGGVCNDPGCHACGFSDIAPTCAAACPPSCGPLMALWCRMSVRGEAPLFWRRAAGPPPLVTTSPVGTAAGVAGELGQASTSILLGNGTLNEDLTAGARITLSTWLDPVQEYGLIFRYWNAGDQDDTYNFNSNEHPILARPFFNTTVPGNFENDTQLVAFSGQLAGSIQVDSRSAVDGLELSLRRRIYQDRFTRVDWLYGYQHVSIDESMVISSSTNVIGQDTMISVTDGFHTENSFHGVSYGLMSSRSVACWKMETMFRLGAGNLRRQVNIGGSTTTSGGGQSNTEPQGLLARNTNSRGFVDDTFIVVPEVGINFAYQLRPGLDFNVGYNYLNVPKVAQASQQIPDDLAVNLSDPLTGTLDPQFRFDERSYWLHSLGLGLQLRY